MKNLLPHLKVGDRVRVKVIERVSPQEMICSFEGDLLRVSNRTLLSIQVGDEITLEVLSLRPLQLTVPTRKETSISRHV